jgi:hypothetical protein
MPSLLNKSLVGILIGSCTSLFSYWTLITYLNRRKYRHIPGPPTKGKCESKGDLVSCLRLKLPATREEKLNKNIDE